MTESARHINSSQKFAGIFEILISTFWSFHNAETFYDYRAHPEILRAFIIPDWILIFHFLTGLIGIWSGIQIWRATWSIKKGYLIFLGLWAIGQIMYYVTTGF
jgi:hypothetical protein